MDKKLEEKRQEEKKLEEKKQEEKRQEEKKLEEKKQEEKRQEEKKQEEKKQEKKQEEKRQEKKQEKKQEEKQEKKQEKKQEEKKHVEQQTVGKNDKTPVILMEVTICESGELQSYDSSRIEPPRNSTAGEPSKPVRTFSHRRSRSLETSDAQEENNTKATEQTTVQNIPAASGDQKEKDAAQTLRQYSGIRSKPPSPWAHKWRRDFQLGGTQSRSYSGIFIAEPGQELPSLKDTGVVQEDMRRERFGMSMTYFKEAEEHDKARKELSRIRKEKKIVKVARGTPN